MKTIELTVAEFRDIQGMKSQVEANSVMNFLKAQGLAVEIGKRKRADGRGKPATVYRIPQEVTLQLFKDSDVPKAVESETEETAEA